MADTNNTDLISTEKDSEGSVQNNANALNNQFNESRQELFKSTKAGSLNTKNAFTEVTQAQISARGHSYEQLLNNYVELSKSRNDRKEDKKDDFYILIKAVLIISGAFFFIFLMRVVCLPVDDMIKLLPTSVAAMVAFLGEFISLPTIIAKYLFNNDEDNNMTEIIKHTQDFDINSQNSMNDKNNSK